MTFKTIKTPNLFVIHGISLLNKIILHKPPSRVHGHSLGGDPGGYAPWSSWVLSILRPILNEIFFLYFCSWHIGKTLWFWILYIKFSCQYYIKANQNFYTTVSISWWISVTDFFWSNPRSVVLFAQTDTRGISRGKWHQHLQKMQKHLKCCLNNQKQSISQNFWMLWT